MGKHQQISVMVEKTKAQEHIASDSRAFMDKSPDSKIPALAADSACGWLLHTWIVRITADSACSCRRHWLLC